MNGLKSMNSWAGNGEYSSSRSAQGYLNANQISFSASVGGSGCGSSDPKPSACGAGDGGSTPKPSACGAGDSDPKPSACGAGDDSKPKTSACGSACGAGEK